MNFIREKERDIVIESVQLHRAVKEHADEFKKMLLKDIDEGYRKIVVDLTNCLYVDSTFLSSLLIAMKTVSKLNGSVSLVAVHPELLSLLDLTGMIRIFKVFRNRQEAVRNYS